MAYSTVIPYPCCDGAADAIAWYGEVFGAREEFRIPGTDGRIGHAELHFGDATVMLADEWPEGGVLAPPTIGGTAGTCTPRWRKCRTRRCSAAPPTSPERGWRVSRSARGRRRGR